MSLPGFTAEVSAYKTSNTYYGTSSTLTSDGSGAVFLQQSSCQEQCQQEFDSCLQNCPPCSTFLCGSGRPPCCRGACVPLGIGGLMACSG